jgi:adenine phosphoribosyltransferase
MNETKIRLERFIREIPDWPVKGVLFRDITPLLADAAAFKQALQDMTQPFAGKHIDCVAAVEARGFIFGSAIAEKLEAGFIPIRKKGKLPFRTTSLTYDLEYGVDTIEVHTDAIKKGAQVLLVDDLLATGGTMGAAARLVEKLGGKVVGMSFLVELGFLHGRSKLGDYQVASVISY